MLNRHVRADESPRPIRTHKRLTGRRPHPWPKLHPVVGQREGLAPPAAAVIRRKRRLAERQATLVLHVLLHDVEYHVPRLFGVRHVVLDEGGKRKVHGCVCAIVDKLGAPTSNS